MICYGYALTSVLTNGESRWTRCCAQSDCERRDARDDWRRAARTDMADTEGIMVWMCREAILRPTQDALVRDSASSS